MSRFGEGRGRAVALLAAIVALAMASSALATTAPAPTKPRASTGGVKDVRGTSGQLDGVVDPNGVETSYHFEYGPTAAYGTQTKAVPVGNGLKGVKVGQPVTGLLVGYHYRIVAVTATGVTVVGKDKTFTGGKSGRLKINLPHGKEEELLVAYGGTLELDGSLSGLGSASHSLMLQGDAYPFTSPFTTLAGPVLSTSTGSFVFKLSKLTQNLELRVVTSDVRPMYSSVVTVHVTPSIRLHVHALKGGRYRFYGTVSPAKLSGIVEIQKLEPQKASSKRSGPKPHAVGTTRLSKGTSTSSRFNVVLSGLTGTSHYRAFIKLAKGTLTSGHSNNVLIHGPRAASKKKKGHKRKK